MKIDGKQIKTTLSQVTKAGNLLLCRTNICLFSLQDTTLLFHISGPAGTFTTKLEIEREEADTDFSTCISPTRIATLLPTTDVSLVVKTDKQDRTTLVVNGKNVVMRLNPFLQFDPYLMDSLEATLSAGESYVKYYEFRPTGNFIFPLAKEENLPVYIIDGLAIIENIPSQYIVFPVVSLAEQSVMETFGDVSLPNIPFLMFSQGFILGKLADQQQDNHEKLVAIRDDSILIIVTHPHELATGPKARLDMVKGVIQQLPDYSIVYEKTEILNALKTLNNLLKVSQMLDNPIILTTSVGKEEEEASSELTLKTDAGEVVYTIHGKLIVSHNTRLGLSLRAMLDCVQAIPNDEITLLGFTIENKTTFPILYINESTFIALSTYNLD